MSKAHNVIRNFNKVLEHLEYVDFAYLKPEEYKKPTGKRVKECIKIVNELFWMLQPIDITDYINIIPLTDGSIALKFKFRFEKENHVDNDSVLYLLMTPNTIYTYDFEFDFKDYTIGGKEYKEVSNRLIEDIVFTLFNLNIVQDKNKVDCV